MGIVGITGHTKGIGKAFSEYFLSKGYEVVGFSRSNGYDIKKEEDRQRIVEASKNFDIFINNAYDFMTDDTGQNHLLYSITKEWYNQDKILVNLSSIGGDFPETKIPYNINKNKQYQHLKTFSHTTKKLHTINIKPFWTSTEWVNRTWPDIASGTYNYPEIGKIEISEIIKTLDFILTNKSSMRITEISIYPTLS